MFEVNNGIANIDGAKGKYNSNNVANPSVEYGRNAVNNYYSYLEQPLVNQDNTPAPILDFGINNPNAAEENAEKIEKLIEHNDEYFKSLPPLEYEYRYMPNIHKKGEIDKDALMGAAYEEMGRRKEISLGEMNHVFSINNNFTANPIDINQDGRVDVGEYGSTILAADMLSKSETPDFNNIDGTINNKGFNKILEYTQKSNAQAATDLYSSIYNRYNLADAAKKFNPEG